MVSALLQKLTETQSAAVKPFLQQQKDNLRKMSPDQLGTEINDFLLSKKMVASESRKVSNIIENNKQRFQVQ